jgi:hypothetical protein
MRKGILISIFLLAFFLTTGIASAHVHFGFVFPPLFLGFGASPAIVAPPPAYYPYPYSYYSYPYPYGYYGPGYYGYRVRVPGHWNYVRSYGGWARVWIPGHWTYRR